MVGVSLVCLLATQKEQNQSQHHEASRSNDKRDTYVGFNHLKELWELDPEPVTILKEPVLVLCVELVPVLSRLCMITLDQFLRNGVLLLTSNLFQRVLFLFLTPFSVIPAPMVET